MHPEVATHLMQIVTAARRIELLSKPPIDFGAEPKLPPTGLNLADAVDQYECSLIRQALERTAGNRAQAARLLRMNRTTLVERLRALGLSNVGKET